MLSEKIKKNQHILRDLLQSFDWNETREGVSQESRARVLLLGLPGAGKSTLFNQLCGWTVSQPCPTPAEGGHTGKGGANDRGVAGEKAVTGENGIEDFGLFCLVDLPQDAEPQHTVGAYESVIPPYGYISGDNNYNLNSYLDSLGSALPMDPLELAEGADLLVYVLDGAAGVRAADFRWVGRLRRLGVPLLVILNKSDLIADELAAHQAQIEQRLATPAIPVSALAGTNVADALLPKMVSMCSRLTVALGRELHGFRQQAAQRLIHQAAIINGIVALEPVPLIDLPVQIMTLTGLMLRIAAVYDRPPTDVRRREVFIAIGGGLAGRYGAQQLAKLVPVVGWLISSFVGWSATWALGRAAIAYFEAGGDVAVDRNWNQAKGHMNQVCQSVYQRWQGRPRLRLEWGKAEATVVEQEGEE